jgi:hypothetical protein
MFIQDVRQKALNHGGFDYNHGTMFLAPEGDGGAGGAGGAAGFQPPDLTKAEAKAWLEQQVKAATDGLVKNRDAILAEKRQLEADLKAIRDKYSHLGDPDAAKKALDQLRDAEEKALVAKGDIDGLVTRRLKETTSRFEAERAAAKAEAETFKKTAEQRAEMVRKLTVDRELTEAAAKAGVHPTAIADLLNRARNVFTVSDDGKISCVDGNGVPINEQDGKPRTPATWVESLKAEAPHFFPGGSGAGSRGGNSPGGNGDVVRLAPGYTQEQYEQAAALARKEGKRLEFPRE